MALRPPNVSALSSVSSYSSNGRYYKINVIISGSAFGLGTNATCRDNVAYASPHMLAKAVLAPTTGALFGLGRNDWQLGCKSQV